MTDAEPDHLRWSAPAALALLYLILALLAFRQTPFAGGDDAIYTSLGQSLLHGQGYVNIWDPARAPQTQYPPVFPAIVALGLGAGLSTDVGLVLMMVCLSAVAVFVSCLFLFRVANRGIAFSAGFFIAISPDIIRNGRPILSDVPFWILSLVALILWHRADTARKTAESESGAMSVKLVIAAAAATVAADFTRSAGLPLLLAVFLWLFLQKQRRALIITAALAIPLIAFWWYRSHVHGGNGYLLAATAVDPYNHSRGNADLNDLIQRIGANAAAYASRHLSWLVFGNPTHGLIFGIPFSAAVLFGWARRVRKLSLPELWFPFYAGLVLVWPATWAGSRFLLPVVPLIALYVAETTGVIAGLTSFPKVIGAVVVVTGAFFVSTALREEFREGHACRQQYNMGNKFACSDSAFGDFLATAETARGKLPKGSVVWSRKPAVFFQHSGYTSRMYPLYAVPDSLFRQSAQIGAEYLVVDEISDLANRYLKPILSADRSNFCVMPEISTRHAKFLRIVSDVPASPHGTAPDSIGICGSS